jgi:hypothetical protein
VENSFQIKLKEQNTGITGSVRYWKTSGREERGGSELKKEVLWEDGRK